MPSAAGLMGGNDPRVRRSERLGWIAVGTVTVLLVMMAAWIVLYEVRGQRELEECRDRFPQGSDAQSRCYDE